MVSFSWQPNILKYLPGLLMLPNVSLGHYRTLALFFVLRSRTLIWNYIQKELEVALEIIQSVPHITDEESRGREELTCPRSQNRLVTKPALNNLFPQASIPSF